MRDSITMVRDRDRELTLIFLVRFNDYFKNLEIVFESILIEWIMQLIDRLIEKRVRIM